MIRRTANPPLQRRPITRPIPTRRALPKRNHPTRSLATALAEPASVVCSDTIVARVCTVDYCRNTFRFPIWCACTAFAALPSLEAVILCPTTCRHRCVADPIPPNACNPTSEPPTVGVWNPLPSRIHPRVRSMTMTTWMMVLILLLKSNLLS